MSTATLNQIASEYKVADLALADWGRKEITVAEHEMPGLMSIRKKYAKDKPLAGVRVVGGHLVRGMIGRVAAPVRPIEALRAGAQAG